jgi:hypothetical protein
MMKVKQQQHDECKIATWWAPNNNNKYKIIGNNTMNAMHNNNIMNTK